jgi:hypothetical protein
VDDLRALNRRLTGAGSGVPPAGTHFAFFILIAMDERHMRLFIHDITFSDPFQMGIEPQMEQNLRLGDVHNKIDDVIHSLDHLEICIFVILPLPVRRSFSDIIFEDPFQQCHLPRSSPRAPAWAYATWPTASASLAGASPNFIRLVLCTGGGCQ